MDKHLKMPFKSHLRNAQLPLQDMPPFVGRPSYGRIVPVGAAKVIAAAMAAPDAGVHEESPKGSFWENLFFIENKKGRIMV